MKHVQVHCLIRPLRVQHKFESKQSVDEAEIAPAPICFNSTGSTTQKVDVVHLFDL